MIRIFFTRMADKLPDSKFGQYLGSLPASLQLKNQRYVRWQDRHANVLGKLLLIEALSAYGYGKDCLDQLKYNEFNKPYICPDIDFNIAHSGKLVICAIGSGLKLGIDVEKVRPVDVAHFNDVMTAEELNNIAESTEPYKTFFKLWVIKESIAKADNRGLGLCFKHFELSRDVGIYDHAVWFLDQLQLDTDHICYLATNKKNVQKTIIYKEFYN